ncbi:hypothetical protein ABEY41_26145 [Peribacillus butanolivorans]|uniref:hypothetical protein n=1 Tax=Peribacillus butanolivorans TaxID=421767 RepID=UPI0034759C2F
MCVLCGEFVHQVHWTDHTSKEQEEITVGDNQRLRKRSRLHRAELCNKILQHFKLKLEDWQGSKFVLRDAKGNTVVVDDLAAIWSNVERMLRYPIDPLNDDLLERLLHQENK